MKESWLRHRLDELVAEQPPTRHTDAATLKQGRRRLMARRAIAAGGAGALAVGAVAVMPALWPDGDTATPDPVASTPEPLTDDDDEILQQCTSTESNALDPAVFGPGSTVKTSESIAGYAGAVIISADGRTWGACQLYADPSPEQLSERVGPPDGYPMQPPEPSAGGLETNGWEVDESLRYIDRFPADVARVELRFGSGLMLSAETVDGFVVLQRDRQSIGDQEQASITLYGADDQVLADESTAPGDSLLPPEYRTLVPDPGEGPQVRRATD